MTRGVQPKDSVQSKGSAQPKDSVQPKDSAQPKGSAQPEARVVIIGNGMAGSRIAEEIHNLSPAARVTVFGAEPHPAYNRILLSEVLAGRAELEHAMLGSPPGIDTRTGVTVTGIDRQHRLVHTACGGAARYDTLVLATGSVPVLPPIPGLRPDLPGVEVFRTIGDCRRILDHGARTALVLGGGLLGLEAARGLAARGVKVTVVHGAAFLMERQLDPAGASVLARALAQLGIHIELGAMTVAVEGAFDADARFRGLRLADGRELHADLLVVACGTRPDVSLAATAGLRVERGIVVDDAMRTVTDRHIYAVGECAEHRGQTHGLVAPAWEQAAVAARRITGTDPAATYTGSRPIMRLKASGIELAAMGDTHVDDETAEVVYFSDATRGIYKKLVVRDGRLAGAILLGDVTTVGTVGQLYMRNAPLPPDRLGLLFAGLTTDAPADPAALPDSAVICHCNAVTKRTIRACVMAGASTVADVAARTRATTGCGSCTTTVTALINATLRPPNPNTGAA
jgi:assimilatory nitrate reductase electron transfer subunit